MAGELAVVIGHNVRAARIARGWNQRELAQEIARRDTTVANPADSAVSNTAVSEWERGVRKPSDRYMPILAEALEKTVDWFYRDREETETPDLAGALTAEPEDRLRGLEDAMQSLGREMEALRLSSSNNASEVIRRLGEVQSALAQALDRRRRATGA